MATFENRVDERIAAVPNSPPFCDYGVIAVDLQPICGGRKKLQEVKKKLEANGFCPSDLPIPLFKAWKKLKGRPSLSDDNGYT